MYWSYTNLNYSSTIQYSCDCPPFYKANRKDMILGVEREGCTCLSGDLGQRRNEKGLLFQKIQGLDEGRLMEIAIPEDGVYVDPGMC